MHTTRVSLLERVKDRTDRVAWSEFYDLYWDLIQAYAKSCGLNESDAEEVAGECMPLLVEKLPQFMYDTHRGKFRSWLRRLVTHKVWNRVTRKDQLNETLEGREFIADEAAPDELWDHQWQLAHLQQGLLKLRDQVSESHYAAFKLFVLEDQPGKAVAAKLDMSLNQLYIIKMRLTRRLREIMQLFPDADLTGGNLQGAA